MGRLLNKPSNNEILVNRTENNVFPWPTNTTLIAGDSMLYGIEENKLKRFKARVRVFPGACVDDFYDYLGPLLKKKPSNIILHIGTNDSPNKSAIQIFNEVENLIIYIKKVVPGVQVYFSCPVLRTDNSKANIVLGQLNDYMKSLQYCISNDNVDLTCLGKNGLHLNAKGSGRLAINYISLMRCL